MVLDSIKTSIIVLATQCFFETKEKKKKAYFKKKFKCFIACCVVNGIEIAVNLFLSKVPTLIAYIFRKPFNSVSTFRIFLENKENKLCIQLLKMTSSERLIRQIFLKLVICVLALV